MRALALLTFLLLSGCSSGPEPGQIYENLLSAERIEIDRVGTCSEIKAWYEGMNEMTLEHRGEFELPENLVKSLWIVPQMSEADSARHCFSWTVTHALSGRPVTAYIQPIEELEDYRRLD